MNPTRAYNPLRPDVPQIDPRMAELDREIQAGRGSGPRKPRGPAAESSLCLACMSRICSHAVPGLNSRLSPRQQEVLLLISNGLSNPDIAKILGLTEGTVKVYCCNLLRKLPVKSRFQAALWARDHLDLLRVPVIPTPC